MDYRSKEYFNTKVIETVRLYPLSYHKVKENFKVNSNLEILSNDKILANCINRKYYNEYSTWNEYYKYYKIDNIEALKNDTLKDCIDYIISVFDNIEIIHHDTNRNKPFYSLGILSPISSIRDLPMNWRKEFICLPKDCHYDKINKTLIFNKNCFKMIVNSLNNENFICDILNSKYSKENSRFYLDFPNYLYSCLNKKNDSEKNISYYKYIKNIEFCTVYAEGLSVPRFFINNDEFTNYLYLGRNIIDEIPKNLPIILDLKNMVYHIDMPDDVYAKFLLKVNLNN